MCIPTKVVPPAAGFLKNLSTMARTKVPTVTTQLQTKQSIKTFATLRCGPLNNKGVKRSIGNAPEMASCPVVTYCSILSIFTAIVYMNMAHGAPKKMRN